MSVAVLERAATAAPDGGGPARHAMRRWAWRLYRREWRQQALVLALLIVAVTGTVVGLGIASNVDNLKQNPLFGTANTIVELSGSDAKLSADIAAMRSQLGPIDVIAHQSIPVPGSISSVDLRAEDPHGPYGNVTIRLDSGRYPSGAGEVAVTKDVASLLDLHVGGTWAVGGETRRVVGIVENPLNLSDQFGLAGPGEITSPDSVSVLLDTNQSRLRSFRLASGMPLNVFARGGQNATAVEALVLVLGALGLLFVGLMAVAGFTVMAHRRLRSLGMLGALGATDRNVRQVMLSNGAAVGITAAVGGAIVGLVAWMAFVPTLESLAGHRINRTSLPWWAIATAMLLTVVTAVAAAWWPARAVARISVVAALSGRPPRPQPAHRFAALGGVVSATGLVLLAFADQRRTWFIIFGTVATAVGFLFLAPLAIRAMGAAGRRTTISVRLALRDLCRYQGRSGAALGAITLAIGIAATIAVSAAAAQNPVGPGNLPANQMMLYLTSGGMGDPVPPLRADQLHSLATTVNRMATSIHAGVVLPVAQSYDPQSAPLTAPGGQSQGYPTAALAEVTHRSHGEEISSMLPLYVASPALLAHYGIRADQINPNTDIIAAPRSDLRGLQIFAPVFAPTADTRGKDNSARIAHPTIQTFPQVPRYGSDPAVLITYGAMHALGLQPLPSGWMLQADHPLSAAQIATARQIAAGVGLYIETRHAQKSIAPLLVWSTTAGILLALGVLAMTVGLIRSETANDLRTLAATGASSRTRRNLTAATAGALAFLGAVIGTAGAYAALLAWHRSNLHPLSHVPAANLAVILAGLPVIAAAAGWLLAGREPALISRRPLD